MTNSAQFLQVTDELLSAYLDQAVTLDEKNLVEAAAAADPMIAWRLESLRQTVQLLRTLPAVALPRSFVLTEAQLSAGPARESNGARALPAFNAPRQRAESAPSGWQVLVERWRGFWQPGSPVLRNAMAASFALLLVLLVGDQFLTIRVADLPRSRMTRELPVLSDQLPTAVVVAAQPAAPPTQANAPAAVVVTSDTAATTTEAQSSAPTAAPAAEQRLGTTSTQTAAFAAVPPPGEDQGVVLDPGVSAAVADGGLGGGQESAPTARIVQPIQVAAKQANMAENSEVVTSAAFESPLALPEQAVAMAVAITTTTALTTTAYAEPTPTPAVVSSNSSTLTTSAEITSTASNPPATPVMQAEDPLPREVTPTGRIRLLQLVSALVTLVLAGLWWRSR